MPSLLSENLIHLSDVPKRVPPGRGKRLHASTVFRWIRNGVQAPSGVRIRLEHVRIGKYLYTSSEALERFIAATNEVPIDSPTVRSPAQRERASNKAAQELEKLGV